MTGNFTYQGGLFIHFNSDGITHYPHGLNLYPVPLTKINYYEI